MKDLEYKKWKRVNYINGLLSNVDKENQEFEGEVRKAIVLGEQLFLMLDTKVLINVNYIIKIFTIKFEED